MLSQQLRIYSVERKDGEMKVNDHESERMWKEAVVAKLMLLSRNLLGGVKEYHENSQDTDLRADI
jgi:hypothetical protein